MSMDVVQQKKLKNIAVIIPAHNEEKALPQVLGDLPRDMVQTVIVVDNASTDLTAEIARNMGCRVAHEQRRGYGRACLTGIDLLPEDTDIVVFLDADYSDHPEQLDRLIAPITFRGYDFVLGSRTLGRRDPGAMTPQSYFGNKLACFLMRIFWGVKYTDLGPFRAITFSALKKIAMSDTDFGWTIEMQIKAAEYGLKTTETAVDYRRRIGRSKISGTLEGTLRAGSKILWTIFKYRFLRRAGAVSPGGKVK